MNPTNPIIKLISSLFCLLFCLLSISTSLYCQDDNTTECPYFDISSTDSLGIGFSLISTNIEATISGVISNVVVEQVYVNEGDSTIDATYVFPMSTNAAIYGMEMDVNERTIIAEIRRKAEAQEIFDTANQSGQTASLLEQQRPNVFQMSLANIEPWDTIAVRMVYTELLVPKKGVYQFVFPSIVGPRFSNNGEPWVNQAAINSTPVSETELNIDLKINAGMPLNADCKSHTVTFDYQGNSAQTILNTSPGSDFIVDYTLDDHSIETGLLLYEGVEENFFLSILQPAAPDVPFTSQARDYIFVVDVSGSMRGRPLDVSKELILNLLSDLNSNDKFNIIFFAGGASMLSTTSLPVTTDNIALAAEMIENINAGGGTQLLPALEQALAIESNRNFAKTFLIITDGFVTVEKQAFDLIRANLGEANFFAFGIGDRVNRFIIEGIAYVGEGEPFVVTDLLDANDMADAFKEYIENPVLTNIEAVFDGIEVYDVEPLTVPDVFAERPIIIYGKYNTPSEGSVTLNGDYANGVVSSSFNFEDFTADADENIALQYLWARKRIRLMSDYGIASNENDTLSIEEEITLLGLKYNLITEFTSFVAVDSTVLVSNDTNTDTDPGSGGTVVDTKNVADFPDDEAIIKILGPAVESNGILRFALEKPNVYNFEEISVQIITMNGEIIILEDLGFPDFENIFSVPLRQIPSGTYLISISTDSKIIDTQKFIVVN